MLNDDEKFQKLLMSTFTTSELHQFIVHNFGQEMADRLPATTVSLSDYTFNAVKSLKHDRVNPDKFILALKGRRPNLTIDIRVVTAALCLPDEDSASSGLASLKSSESENRGEANAKVGTRKRPLMSIGGAVALSAVALMTVPSVSSRGTNDPSGKALIDERRECNRGTIERDGECKACPPNHIAVSDSCQNCGRLHFSIENRCERCPDGMVSSVGGCEPCPQDSYLQGEICRTCPERTILTVRGDCRPCRSDEISEDGDCRRCSEREFVQGNRCLQCDEREILESGECIQCDDRSMQLGNRCIPCQENEARIENNCVECPAEEFLHGNACATCPSGMAVVKKGTSKAFCMDKTEVTVESFQEWSSSGIFSSMCPAMGATTSRECNINAPSRHHHPINCVSWGCAFEFCAAHGKRLPTRKQWYDALYSRQLSQRQTCNTGWFHNCGSLGTAEVGRRPGESTRHHRDLMGNLWEWSSDSYGGSGKYYVLGCSWTNPPERCTSDSSFPQEQDLPRIDIGFRCVTDIHLPS